MFRFQKAFNNPEHLQLWDRELFTPSLRNLEDLSAKVCVSAVGASAIDDMDPVDLLSLLNTPKQHKSYSRNPAGVFSLAISSLRSIYLTSQQVCRLINALVCVSNNF